MTQLTEDDSVSPTHQDDLRVTMQTRLTALKEAIIRIPSIVEDLAYQIPDGITNEERLRIAALVADMRLAATGLTDTSDEQPIDSLSLLEQQLSLIAWMEQHDARLAEVLSRSPGLADAFSERITRENGPLVPVALAFGPATRAAVGEHDPDPVVMATGPAGSATPETATALYERWREGREAARQAFLSEATRRLTHNVKDALARGARGEIPYSNTSSEIDFTLENGLQLNDLWEAMEALSDSNPARFIAAKLSIEWAANRAEVRRDDRQGEHRAERDELLALGRANPNAQALLLRALNSEPPLVVDGIRLGELVRRMTAADPELRSILNEQLPFSITDTTADSWMPDWISPYNGPYQSPDLIKAVGFYTLPGRRRGEPSLVDPAEPSKSLGVAYDAANVAESTAARARGAVVGVLAEAMRDPTTASVLVAATTNNSHARQLVNDARALNNPTVDEPLVASGEGAGSRAIAESPGQWIHRISSVLQPIDTQKSNDYVADRAAAYVLQHATGVVTQHTSPTGRQTAQEVAALAEVVLLTPQLQPALAQHIAAVDDAPTVAALAPLHAATAPAIVARANDEVTAERAMDALKAGIVNSPRNAGLLVVTSTGNAEAIVRKAQAYSQGADLVRAANRATRRVSMPNALSASTDRPVSEVPPAAVVNAARRAMLPTSDLTMPAELIGYLGASGRFKRQSRARYVAAAAALTERTTLRRETALKSAPILRGAQLPENNATARLTQSFAAAGHPIDPEDPGYSGPSSEPRRPLPTHGGGSGPMSRHAGNGADDSTSAKGSPPRAGWRRRGGTGNRARATSPSTAGRHVAPGLRRGAKTGRSGTTGRTIGQGPAVAPNLTTRPQPLPPRSAPVSPPANGRREVGGRRAGTQGESGRPALERRPPGRPESSPGGSVRPGISPIHRFEPVRNARVCCTAS